MRVTAESPVEDRESYLFKWDTAARSYFNHYEIHKQAAREGLRRLFQNVLTRNKDPIQYEHRFKEIDAIATRQLLGDISCEEVAELNSVFGSKNGSYYFKNYKEPASLTAWKLYPLAAMWAATASIAGYARFVKGYNNLWLIGGFVPLWTYIVYQYARQPTQEISNCYNYLLSKRAATCELQANSKRFSQNEFANTEQYRKLRNALEMNNSTLYQLEAEIIDKINSGVFK